MPEYDKMYTLLCSAIDEALFSLEKTGEAKEIYAQLQAALLDAEELYITSSSEPC